MRRFALCLVLAVVLVACAQPSSSPRPAAPRTPVSPSPSQGSAGLPAASASAAAGGQDVLIVVRAFTPQDQAGSLDLYRPDGTRTAKFAVKSGSNVLAAAGSRVFVASGDQLEAIRRDGSVESLGTLGASEVRWFAANPNGTRWIWSTYEDAAGTTHSAVHLGGDGLAARTVEQLSEPGRTLGPLTWTRRGAFVQWAPVGGHGGYFPFARTAGWLLVEGPVHRLDPETAAVTPVPGSPRCAFGDWATDNSVICFPGGSNVRIYAQSGKVIDIALATPRFNIPDEAFCSPTEAICTVAGATGVGNAMQYADSNAPPEQYGTDLIRTDGSISRFGPDGVDPAMGPQSWLPNGRLVLWRRPGAAGGVSGIYVLDRSGQGPFIATTSEPIGYLN